MQNWEKIVTFREILIPYAPFEFRLTGVFDFLEYLHAKVDFQGQFISVNLVAQFFNVPIQVLTLAL